MRCFILTCLALVGLLAQRAPVAPAVEVGAFDLLPNTFALTLSDTLNGPTDFADTPASFSGEPGTLTIVPEPASLGVLGFAVLRLLGRRRR